MHTCLIEQAIGGLQGLEHTYVHVHVIVSLHNCGLREVCVIVFN